MNDIERAIKTLKSINVCGICTYSETGCSDCERNISKTLAIQALQEKAERENPKPLTLEQLKERDGKPVYIASVDKDLRGFNGWGIVKSYTENFDVIKIGDEYFKGSMCGKSYNAYDHEPKEATDDR